MTADVAVVGGGLFGSVVAAWLRRLGMAVELFDHEDPLAGSRPSASLIKPSWLSAMRRGDVDAGFEVLDALYGVQDLRFRVGPLHVDTVRWCDPRKICSGPRARATVVRIDRDGPALELHSGRRVEARHVVVAAGVHCQRFVPVPDLQGKAGLACLFRGEQIAEPFIRPWAPYKQVVGFNLGRDLWVGDGSAIKVENWTYDRRMASIKRCVAAVDRFGAPVEVLNGVRPYVPKRHLRGDPCYLRRVVGEVYVATGGAKNGTIAAGWAAHELGRRLT